jgi:hypothetical protein
MPVPIDVGDTFVWQSDCKNASAGDTVLVTNIYVDEDTIPQVSILNYRDETELVTAQDIHDKVAAGLLVKE